MVTKQSPFWDLCPLPDELRDDERGVPEYRHEIADPYIDELANDICFGGRNLNIEPVIRDGRPYLMIYEIGHTIGQLASRAAFQIMTVEEYRTKHGEDRVRMNESRRRRHREHEQEMQRTGIATKGAK